MKLSPECSAVCGGKPWVPNLPRSSVFIKSFPDIGIPRVSGQLIDLWVHIFPVPHRKIGFLSPSAFTTITFLYRHGEPALPSRAINNSLLISIVNGPGLPWFLTAFVPFGWGEREDHRANTNGTIFHQIVVQKKVFCDSLGSSRSRR